MPSGYYWAYKERKLGPNGGGKKRNRARKKAERGSRRANRKR